MQNVLHNAVKYSPEDGGINVSADQDAGNGQIVLTIADRGPGLDPYELKRVFERLYRGDRARQTPGTGLGLAITKHIMRAHGGCA